MRKRYRTLALAVVGAAVLAAATVAGASTRAASSAVAKKKPVPSFHLRIGTILPFNRTAL